MKFLENVEDPSYFPSSCPIVYLTFRSEGIAISLIVEVVVKPNKCKSFLDLIFSGEMTPTFLRRFVSVIYHPPFGKVWLSSVCEA